MHVIEVYEIDRFLHLKYGRGRNFREKKRQFLSSNFENLIQENSLIYLFLQDGREIGAIWIENVKVHPQIREVILLQEYQTIEMLKKMEEEFESETIFSIFKKNEGKKRTLLLIREKIKENSYN